MNLQRRVQSGSAGTVRLDADNTVEPDAFLGIETGYGGQSTIDSDDYLDGAPELTAEIAASAVSNDLHTKLNVYRRNNVQEYIVRRTEDHALDWFQLRDGKYERTDPNERGVIQSIIFPGLWLAVNSLLEDDIAAVMGVLPQGTASSEHQGFIEKLRNSAQE